MYLFNNWFFDRFPHWHKRNDTYKDSNGRGIWERYLSIFGQDLDEVTMPLLRNGGDIVNPEISSDLLGSILTPGEQVDDKFLNLIAQTLAYPPHRNIYSNPDNIQTEIKLYRNLLSMTASLIKIRGTARALEIWGNLLGLNLTVYELGGLNTRYDIVDWDSTIEDLLGEHIITYDTDCELCGQYVVAISQSVCGVNTSVDITEELLEILKRAICYNEPINAKLGAIIPQTTFCDEVNKCSDEKLTFTIIKETTYDSPVRYDFQDTYDNYGEDVEEIVNSDCEEGIEFWAIEKDFVVS